MPGHIKRQDHLSVFTSPVPYHLQLLFKMLGPPFLLSLHRRADEGQTRLSGATNLTVLAPAQLRQHEAQRRRGRNAGCLLIIPHRQETFTVVLRGATMRAAMCEP